MPLLQYAPKLLYLIPVPLFFSFSLAIDHHPSMKLFEKFSNEFSYECFIVFVEYWYSKAKRIELHNDSQWCSWSIAGIAILWNPPPISLKDSFDFTRPLWFLFHCISSMSLGSISNVHGPIFSWNKIFFLLNLRNISNMVGDKPHVVQEIWTWYKKTRLGFIFFLHNS